MSRPGSGAGPRWRIARAAGLGVAAVAASGVATGLYAWAIERVRFGLERVTVAALPAGSPDVRILHLGDLHLAPWQTRKMAFVRGLALLEPDLVVNTGDNMGHADALPYLRETLAPFRGVPGVFVYGSNDYYGPLLKNPFTYFTGRRPGSPTAPRLDISGLDALLRDELSWASLNNAAAVVEAGGVRLRAIGVDDPHIRSDRLVEARASLASLPAETGELPLLGVVHAPYRRILDAFTDLGAVALIAGHTHGGQVCVPGVGALVTNCDLPRSQVSGLSEWRSGARRAPLYVTRGLGTSIYAPVRFACPPQATLITLTARAAG